MKKRCHTLEQCSALVRFFSSSIGYGDEPLSLIVKRAVDSSAFEELTFLNAVNRDDLSRGFSAVWSNSIDACNDALDKEGKALLKSFGSRLGKTDTTDQLEFCEYYKEQFAQREAQARKNVKEQVKLCRLSGSAVGALLIVLLSGG